MTAIQVRPIPAEPEDNQRAAELLEGARSLRPLIEASADQIERERQVPETIVTAMAEAGLLTMLVPHEMGGAQTDPLTFLHAVEEVSRFDGSTGWCLFVAAVTAITAGTLREDAARAIWGHPRGFVAGSIATAGTATVVDGGNRLRGHWTFASGCRNATYMVAQCTVLEGDAPRLGRSGSASKRPGLGVPKIRYSCDRPVHTLPRRRSRSSRRSGRWLARPASLAEPPLSGACATPRLAPRTSASARLSSREPASCCSDGAPRRRRTVAGSPDATRAERTRL